MSGTILLVTSYALLGVFVVGFVARSIRLARLPVHLRWELAPVPHEKGKGHYGGSYLEELEWWTKPREKSLVAELKYMLLEIVFLKAVWEHNRGLWWFSFPFHIGLYLLVVTATLLLVATVGGMTGAAGAGGATMRAVCGFIGGAGYGVGTVGAVGLLAKRLFDPQLRDFTTPVSLFNLVLLLAVFASGLATLAGGEYVHGITTYLTALGTADAAAVVPRVAALHVALTILFLAYLPYTKMMHFVAKYFTYHEVRWNDAPMVAGSRMEREVQELLAQSVTWAGPHLHADGKKNWVDIATEEVGR
jgi:nitrate reductase gamma subunit